uniref:Uncharacterized protein n=1 Tax=Oryza sativa subsp. japonica TaxID=39947 RepID=Q67TM5_ORYSJ|nr:hypothetical protein [Oryza sativa Japonica Group]
MATVRARARALPTTATAGGDGGARRRRAVMLKRRLTGGGAKAAARREREGKKKREGVPHRGWPARRKTMANGDGKPREDDVGGRTSFGVP